MNKNAPAKKKVIVVGGGFAGLNAVRSLDHKRFDILLIDRINHHQFQPLFYQVATSQIEPTTISFPLRYIFRKDYEVKIRLAEVRSVDHHSKMLSTSIGEFTYDILILAMGATTNFFGNDELRKHAFTLKTTYDAIQIRNHILQSFENLINNPADESSKTIVLVGAGPTGVELAGSFAEIRRDILPKDFHRLDFNQLRIILIDGSANTLNAMSEASRKHSRKYLEELGVEIITDTVVTSYDGNVITTNHGDTIPTHTVIWSAGVISNTIQGLPKECVGRGNRLKVDPYNELINHPGIYVLGDMALMETSEHPSGHPQLANVAIQQAKNLARNLNRSEHGKSKRAYEFKDLGTMATIGRNKAVVDLPFVKFQGFFAWFVWMFLHLMLILSVRNKLIIFFFFTSAYLTRNTALRIILKGRETEK